MRRGATSFLADGVTRCAGRILVIMYGQSNMRGMVTDTATPPTAAANTFLYNNTSGLIETPGPGFSQGEPGNGNGVINLLNDIAAANPGRVIVAVDGSAPGSSINGLTKIDDTGTILNTNFQTLMARVRAARRANDRIVIVWHQGEGDATTAPHETEIDYKVYLSRVHADIVGDLGLSKPQVPLFIGTLGTNGSVYTPTPTGAGKQDQTYTTIRLAHINAANEQTNVHLSHSSMDLPRVDVDHYSPAGYGNAGKRFAQSINTYLGTASGEARFSIASVALGTATTTLVNLQHVLGTDFTVGTDGWQVSGNNGATWIAATPSRVSATQISLSHASLASLSRTRLVRYQYGQNPTVTSPVKDNSALAIPLLPTTWDQAPTNPSTVIPVPTWRTTTSRGPAAATQNFLKLPLGPEQVQKFVIIGLTGGVDTGASTVTLTPNQGATVTATVVQQVLGSHAAIFKALIPSSAATFTDVQVSTVGGFAEVMVTLWTVPVSDLTSQTETGSRAQTFAASTVATINNLNASAGGFAVGVAYNGSGLAASYGSITSPIGTSSGSTTTGDSWAQRWEYIAGNEFQVGDASNLTASAASTVTFTFSDAGSLETAVAAWR